MTGTVSSLSRQLVLPVAGLVLAAVLANVGFSAWLATQRSLAAARAGQEQVAAALEAARIALSPQVLDTLQRLTGSHFVVWNPAARTADASTLPAGTIDDRRAADLADTVGASAVIDGRRYRIGLVRASGVRPESVLVLTPLASPSPPRRSPCSCRSACGRRAGSPAVSARSSDTSVGSPPVTSAAVSRTQARRPPRRRSMNSAASSMASTG
jgi:hypothetical protein